MKFISCITMVIIGSLTVASEATAADDKDPKSATDAWVKLMKEKTQVAGNLASLIGKAPEPLKTQLKADYCYAIYDAMRVTIQANIDVYINNPKVLNNSMKLQARKLIDIETKNNPEIPNDVRKLYRKLLEDHKELGKAYRDADGKGFPDK